MVTITAIRGLNIALKIRLMIKMHHAWRKNDTTDPITPYMQTLIVVLL